MKNTHTPGPWEVRNGCNVFANAAHVPLTNDGLIAVTGGLSGRDTIDRDAANARLIAEAPAMLEALRAIATYMRGDLTTDDFKAFGLKRGDMTGNVRRIAENVLTRIDGEAAQ